MCAALEWQFSQGGGRIIEDNKTISVNNPRAIRAWQSGPLGGFHLSTQRSWIQRI